MLQQKIALNKRGLWELLQTKIITKFFLGWCLFLDVAIFNSSPDFYKNPLHVCGIIGTFSLIMINSVSFGELRGDDYVRVCFGYFGLMGARILYLVGLLLGIIAVIACLGILIANYIIPVKVLLCLSISIGIIFVMAAGYNGTWWYLFLLVFYVLAPIPFFISSDGMSSTNPRKELALFVTSGIVVLAFYLPFFLARIGGIVEKS